MSIQYSKLCSQIIRQHFGETVAKVSDALFSAPSRTLSMVVKATDLPRAEVKLALAILLKFRLISFEQSLVSENLAEYILKHDVIILILRYPRYIQHSQATFGDVGSSIIEEFLRSGSQTASTVILSLFLSSDNREKLEGYRDMFIKLVNLHYLTRVPITKESEETITAVPKLHIDCNELFTPPVLDLAVLQKLNSGIAVENKDVMYWQVNYDRFHQDFRDELMITAIERKIGTSASECFRHIIQLMYERTDAWQPDYSNPIPFVEIKQRIEKKSHNIDMIRHLEQYVSVIAEDTLGLLRRVGDAGAGQYVIGLKIGFENLVYACIENIITEKFGSKAARIFRVIKTNKFVEQEEIQKEAMVPAKEAKFLTYKLFEEQYIHIKTIRKPGGGGTGMAKSFFLFQVNEKQVVKMLLDNCFKALYNCMVRSNFEKGENKRLMDKSQRITSIVEAMTERGESEEYINEILESLTPPEREILEKVKIRIKTLSSSELAIDNTIFLLHVFQYYASS